MRKLTAYPTYLILNGVDGLTFSLITTVSLVYQVTMVGLDPLQLVLVGTTLELSAFLFEVPTGIVADVYSRRLSIIIGYVLVGIGFLVEGVSFFRDGADRASPLGSRLYVHERRNRSMDFG